MQVADAQTVKLIQLFSLFFQRLNSLILFGNLSEVFRHRIYTTIMYNERVYEVFDWDFLYQGSDSKSHRNGDIFNVVVVLYFNCIEIFLFYFFFGFRYFNLKIFCDKSKTHIFEKIKKTNTRQYLKSTSKQWLFHSNFSTFGPASWLLDVLLTKICWIFITHQNFSFDM